jgi:predicted nucleotidyltransferase
MPPLPERTDVDVEALRAVLKRHPVRLAVAFGSAVTGETHPWSDLDLAVEFDDTVNDVADAYMSLLADLGRELGSDDVDLGLVEDLKPGVGLAAFEEGVLLVGTADRFEAHRDRFEDTVADLERTRPSLRERFDAVIENVDRALAEDP